MNPKHFLLVILFIFLLVLIFGLLIKPQPSPSFNPALLKPSGKINLNKITVAMDINDILTHKSTKPGNAAELYIKALTSPTLQSMTLSTSGQYPKTYNIDAPELTLIEQAAEIKDCQFVPQYLYPMETYDVFTSWGRRPPYNLPYFGVIDIPQALTQKGEFLSSQGKIDEAIHSYESAILFSHRIIEEPRTIIILLGGYIFMKQPLKDFEKIYRTQGNIMMAQTCLTYYQQIESAQNEVMNKDMIIYRASQSDLPDWARYAVAHVYYAGKSQESINLQIEIALFDKDPIWRKYEILNLGTYRFESYKRVFRKKLPSPYKSQIEDVLKYISTHDSDSTIRQVADNALKLKNYNP